VLHGVKSRKCCSASPLGEDSLSGQGWPQPTPPAAAAAAAAPLSPIRDVTLRRLGENGRPRGWRRKRRVSEHINANMKNHTYDGLTRRASTEVQCRRRTIRRDIQSNPGRTIMMVVAWKMMYEFISQESCRMERKTQNKISAVWSGTSRM
jgi:hypothetical protein